MSFTMLFKCVEYIFRDPFNQSLGLSSAVVSSTICSCAALSLPLGRKLADDEFLEEAGKITH
jgi:hypothetical protein